MNHSINKIFNSFSSWGNRKGAFLLFIFYFLFSTSFAQVQFNIVTESEVVPKPLTIFILSDTGYATVGGANINNLEAVSINIFDINGTLTAFTDYKKDNWNIYRGMENNCIKSDNGNYFISGSAILPTGNIYDPIDSNYVYIYLMNEDFDSLKTYTFLHDTLGIGVSGMCQAHDNGFLIVGKTYRKDNGALVYENSTDAFMLKIDSLGQQEWYKTFGKNTSSHDQDEFCKVVQTPDKGYLCVGYTKSWQSQNFFDKGDWWLVKTDSLGVEQWSRRYGHPDYNDRRPYGLLMSSDTSYYIIGSHVVSHEEGGNSQRASTILKLDVNFNESYIKYYGKPSYVPTNFSAITENNQHEIMVAGYYDISTDLEFLGTVGLLYKLNANGDSIWRRQYTCLDTTNSLNYPYSIKQTTDGGYVFTGIAYDDELSPAQQVWLVKTDEYGCDGTTEFWSCDTGVGINEYAITPTFSISPNPASENFTIAISVESGIQSLEIEIYNMQGQLIKSLSLRGTKQSIKIAALEAGVYFIKVANQTKKLIVK